tara:strand:+ start:1338 stop:2126 length:789 start_codon:yes stop_codon:yes gene_type:complete
LYNKYIVIITAENKEKYISDTIFSCLNNLDNNKIKIIVTYTNLSNELELKIKFKNYENIIFIKSLNKIKYPTQDQLNKIETATKYINNEWVLLLDGDDLFHKDKIKTIENLNLDKNKIYLHNHIKSPVENKKYFKNKSYKKNYFYKKIFNDWPDKIATSSIIVSADLLKKFYKNSNPYKWKYLAIDTQIILFYFYQNKFEYLDYNLITKVEDINSLDKTFLKINKKIFWIRRMEQHKLTKELSGKLNLIDRLITYIFLKILR